MSDNGVQIGMHDDGDVYGNKFINNIFFENSWNTERESTFGGYGVEMRIMSFNIGNRGADSYENGALFANKSIEIAGNLFKSLLGEGGAIFNVSSWDQPATNGDYTLAHMQSEFPEFFHGNTENDDFRFANATGAPKAGFNIFLDDWSHAAGVSVPIGVEFTSITEIIAPDQIRVGCAGYFFAGKTLWDDGAQAWIAEGSQIIQNDELRINAASGPVRAGIAGINYASNIITLEFPVEVSVGDSVHLWYYGDNPGVGAHGYAAGDTMGMHKSRLNAIIWEARKIIANNQEYPGRYNPGDINALNSRLALAQVMFSDNSATRAQVEAEVRSMYGFIDSIIDAHADILYDAKQAQAGGGILITFDSSRTLALSDIQVIDSTEGMSPLAASQPGRFASTADMILGEPSVVSGSGGRAWLVPATNITQDGHLLFRINGGRPHPLNTGIDMTTIKVEIKK
jgi:hypothetical protein